MVKGVKKGSEKKQTQHTYKNGYHTAEHVLRKLCHTYTNQGCLFHLTRMRIKNQHDFHIQNLLSDTPLENHLLKKSVSNSMIAHSATIFFFHQCGEKLQLWHKFSYVSREDCSQPYKKHCNTTIYILTSIFGSLASETNYIEQFPSYLPASLCLLFFIWQRLFA